MVVYVFAAGLATMILYAFVLFEVRLARVRKRRAEIRQSAIDAMEYERDCHRELVASFGDVKRRAGISLTEVLLSMFVLTVGVLGLAALIPVGGSYLRTAQTDDRSSALGRAAFHDVQVRGHLDPKMWLNSNGTGSNYLTSTAAWTHPRVPGVSMMSPTERATPFVIDPLLIGSNTALAAQTAVFPAALDNDPVPTDGSPIPRIARGTLRAWKSERPTNIQPPAMPLVAADRVFRSTDDVVFGMPDGEPDGRPFAALGSGQQVRQFTGDYSYLITVVPLVEGNNAKALEADGVTPKPPMILQQPQQSCTVSVVVLQKRLLAVPPSTLADRGNLPPTERVVFCDFISGVGLGGGDVQLRLPNAPLSDFPEATPGRWLMLAGWQFHQGAASAFTADEVPAVFRWYRVASAGEPRIENDEVKQDVTLSGPDWWTREVLDMTTAAPNDTANPYLDVDNTTPAPTVHAILIDGVVGVYEKTIRSNGDTMSTGQVSDDLNFLRDNYPYLFPPP